LTTGAQAMGPWRIIRLIGAIETNI
jgi:hypothetical protein